MLATKDNRTLSILNAASAGEYGILSAIAYETHLKSNLGILNRVLATTLNT